MYLSRSDRCDPVIFSVTSRSHPHPDCPWPLSTEKPPHPPPVKPPARSVCETGGGDPSKVTFCVSHVGHGRIFMRNRFPSPTCRLAFMKPGSPWKRRMPSSPRKGTPGSLRCLRGSVHVSFPTVPGPGGGGGRGTAAGPWGDAPPGEAPAGGFSVCESPRTGAWWTLAPRSPLPWGPGPHASCMQGWETNGTWTPSSRSVVVIEWPLPPSAPSPEKVARAGSSCPVTPVPAVAPSGQITIKVSKIHNLERSVSFQNSAEGSRFVGVKEFLGVAVQGASAEERSRGKTGLSPAAVRTCAANGAVIPAGAAAVQPRKGQRRLPRGPRVLTRGAR